MISHIRKGDQINGDQMKKKIKNIEFLLIIGFWSMMFWNIGHETISLILALIFSIWAMIYGTRE